MKSEQRNREKVVAELRSLFDDEAAHYAKYSRAGFRIRAVGIACIASVRSWPILKPLLRDDAMEILSRGGGSP